MEENNLGNFKEKKGAELKKMENSGSPASNEEKNDIWGKIAKYIFAATAFLLPIFVLPFTVSPIEVNKAFLVFIGIALSAIFWLISFIQNGEIKIPKSSVLLMFLLLPLGYLISSVFSDLRNLSLIGEGFGIDSFSTIALLSFAGILSAFLFREKRDISLFFKAIFASFLVLFIFQFVKVAFNFSILPWSIFTSKISNLFGTWNELGIFFGLSALVSMVYLKFFDKNKILASFVFALSLLSLAVINFRVIWIALAVFSLLFLIYIFSNSKDTRSFASLPLMVFIISVLFIFLNPLIGSILTSTNLNYIEVRPSWSGTFDIVKNSLNENPVLGSGPGTFQYNWLLFKPQSINLTQFWASRFNYGIGLIPSLFATSGSVSILLWVAFLLVFLYQFLKILNFKENESNCFAVAAFFAAAYLWLFSIIYVPTFALFALAFVFTGIFIGEIVKDKKIKIININFLGDPKIKFLASLAVLLIITSSLGIFYLFTKKYIASYYFAKGLQVFNSESNIQKSEDYILRSQNLDSQDRYLRALTEIGLIKMQAIFNNTALPPDELRMQFQNTLSATIQYAQKAIDLNKLEPLNASNLAKVYEAVIPLKIEGASNLAISNYSFASKRDPFNPDYLITMARINIQENKLDQARNLLKDAINLKPDYAAPNFMLAQVEAGSGNLEEAIKKTRDTYFLAPNDIGVLFQLGLLYYQNKDYGNAKTAFEKSISLNENYSNARYFLGLIYDIEGKKSDALNEFEKIASLNPENTEVRSIINNLKKGKPALDSIVPPGPSPETRNNPPVEQKR